MIDSIVNGYINLIAIILFLLFVCPTAGVSCIAGATLSALALNGISRKSRSNAPAKQKSQEELTDAATEYIHGLPVVKSFGQEGVSIEEWKSASDKHKNINIKIMNGFVPFNCLHLLGLKAASVALILIAGLLTIHKAMTLPIFLMVSMFAFMIFGGVESINDSVHTLGLKPLWISRNKFKNQNLYTKRAKIFHFQNLTLLFVMFLLDMEKRKFYMKFLLTTFMQNLPSYKSIFPCILQLIIEFCINE